MTSVDSVIRKQTNRATYRHARLLERLLVTCAPHLRTELNT